MKNIIKLTAVLLLATLFFAGCVIGNDNNSTDPTIVEVTPITLVSIEITTKPKAVYFKGEPLDIDGIVVTATYSDDSEEPVTINESNISGFDSSTPGKITLTVTYEGKTAEYEVTIGDATLSRIEITNGPAKTEYHLYETLDLEGIEVTATLSDETTEEIDIDELETEGFDPEQLGEQTITVNIIGFASITDTFTITVIPQTFTVTFNSNGGDTEANPSTKTVTQPATTIDSLPTPPTRIGYNFTEWKDEGGISFTTSYQVTSSFTVYAQWAKQTYTVTFNSNGGGAVADQSVRYEEKASTPTVPSLPLTAKKYTTFGGWYTDDTTFANKWDFTVNTVTGNVALYAKWRDYEIGDTGPGGGKIFYYDPNGFPVNGDTGTFYYLEASPSNLTSKQFKANGDTIALQNGIGQGKKNTQLISAIHIADKEDGAARACVEYNNNGLADWFLPSKDELYQLFLNRDAAGITLLLGNSAGNYYWSSSLGSSTQNATVYYYNTNTNAIVDTTFSRSNSANIRAIRAF